MPVPRSTSRAAKQALKKMGTHMGSGSKKMDKSTKDAYRQWGRILGTHLRPGHRSGSATRAEAFAKLHKPPAMFSVGYDKFHVKKSGKSWRTPYVRLDEKEFTIDWTLVRAIAHWRIRFTGRTRGRASIDQKLALIEFLKTDRMPKPAKGRLTFWNPVPPQFLSTVEGYVRDFLQALADADSMNSDVVPK